MAVTETSVTGLADLDRILKTLPAKVEGNVMRGALRAGQKVIMEEAKALVPVDQGALRDSIRIQFRRRRRKRGWVRMHLVAGNEAAWYASLIEFGTASYYTGKGSSVGKPYKIKPKKQPGALLFGGKVREEVTHPGIRPRPFMRPAVDKAQGRALDAVGDYIRKRLPREVKKAGL
jgi:HK97 gp10 family phage protein